MSALVAAIGDNTIDRYFHLGQSMVGGNAFNVAVHFARIGLKAHYFGAVGPDRSGDRIRDCLRKHGISTKHLKVSAGETAFTEIDNDADGDRILARESYGVGEHYSLDEDDYQDLGRMRHIHVGRFAYVDVLRRRLHGSGVTISQDFAVSSSSETMDVAFASVGADLILARGKVSQLLSAGHKVAVVTCGALGSIGSDGRGTVEVGIREVEVVDTTGAGDTFIAGFLAEWIKQRPVEECLEAGRDLAAETCQHIGGFRQIGAPLRRRTIDSPSGGFGKS
jgi:fructoselysine 6-kinase